MVEGRRRQWLFPLVVNTQRGEKQRIKEMPSVLPLALEGLEACVLNISDVWFIRHSTM
jgi:hypothetical protein